MSDTSYEMDLGTDILWEGDFAEQANPGPPLPADELQPLVMDEGQLFTDSQLVAIMAEPAQDPAPEAPSPTLAQKLVELPGPPLHINLWAEEMEAYAEEQGCLQDAVDKREEELLESDCEEEQQEMGEDHQELLHSSEASSQEGEVVEDVVEQVDSPR